MQRDALADDEGEKLACAVGRVGSKALRFEPQLLLSPLEHRLACRDLIVGACTSGFDVNNNGVFDVDQVIETSRTARAYWPWPSTPSTGP